MNQDISDRFPGAAVLGEAEFAGAVAGRRFRYREIESGLTFEWPAEAFLADGRYQQHGVRTIAYGTYSVEGGVVSVDCSDCPGEFLGLGRERIYFQHEGRLLSMNADGSGGIIELLQAK